MEGPPLFVPAFAAAAGAPVLVGVAAAAAAAPVVVLPSAGTEAAHRPQQQADRARLS